MQLTSRWNITVCYSQIVGVRSGSWSGALLNATGTVYADALVKRSLIAEQVGLLR